MRSTKRWKLAASVSTATGDSRRKAVTTWVSASGVAMYRASLMLIRLAQLLQSGRDLFQRLGEGLVEFGIGRFGWAAQRVTGAFARGPRGGSDVAGKIGRASGR